MPAKTTRKAPTRKSNVPRSKSKSTLNTSFKVSKSQLAIIISLVLVLGAFIIWRVFAATLSNTEVETWPGSGGNVKTVADNTASGGSYAEFLAPSTSTGGSLNLSRIPWEGGSDYWKATNGAQFAKADAAGWSNPNFFPITVFYGKPDTRFVASYKDAGINTVNPPEHDGANLRLITDAGMYAIPKSGEFTQAEVNSDPTNNRVVGWFMLDECDQGEGECWLNGDDTKRPAYQQNIVNAARAYNDGRFVTANYGNGILRTYWSIGTRMNQFAQMVDASSADKYTYTSSDVEGVVQGSPDWPGNNTAGALPVARAYSYGWQADQMRRFQDPNHLRPVWTFIETYRPYLTEAGARSITPQQMEGAVWSAIIHEARGISYFDHNNASTGCTAIYSVVDCADVHAAVKKVNTDVLALAPVINTQSYYNTTEVRNGFTYYRYSFNNGTDTMLKTYSGSAYIFAGLGMKCTKADCTAGVADTTGTKSFTLPAGVTGTTVEVVGENRTLTVTNGSFTDTFPQEYTHHVYRIAL